jgi:hypothetical protein
LIYTKSITSRSYEQPDAPPHPQDSATAGGLPEGGKMMTGRVLPFKKPLKRDADGVLYVPPATREGIIYVLFGRPAARRKKRWCIWTEFCDGTHDLEDTMAADWKTAMFVAKVRAAKYGFRIVDVSDSDYCDFAKSRDLRS